MSGQTPEHAVEAYVQDCRKLDFFFRSTEVDELPSLRALLKSDRRTRAEVVLAAIEAFRGPENHDLHPYLTTLMSRLLRASLPFTDRELVATVELCASLPRRTGMWIPLPAVIRTVERHVAANGRTLTMFVALQRLMKWVPTIGYDASQRKSLKRIAVLLQDPTEAREPDLDAIPIEAGPAWGRDARASLEALPTGSRSAWASLLRHMSASKGKSKPSKRWQQDAAALVDAVGCSQLRSRLVIWLDQVPLGRRPDELVSSVTSLREIPMGPTDHNLDVLKGLLWAAAPLGGGELAKIVAGFSERCFEKIPSYGAASPRLANAALWSLGQMPEHVGIPFLFHLASHVQGKQSRKSVHKALDRAVAAAKLTTKQLEKISTPTPVSRADTSGQRRGAERAFSTVDEGLDGALAELEDGRPSAALAALLAAWRLGRSEAIATQIDILSTALHRSIEPVPTQMRTKHWLQRLADGQPAEIESLMDVLFLGTRKEIRSRLDALLALPPDPRTSHPMIEWLRNPPVSLVLALSGVQEGPPDTVWTGVLKLAVHTGDPRMREALRVKRQEAASSIQERGEAASPYAMERRKRIDRVLPKFTDAGSDEVPEALSARIALVAEGLPLPRNVVRN